MIFSLFLEDEKATERFGEDFALALEKGNLVTLEGDLGTGKTSLSRSIVRTLADDDGMDVPSPTFTLVQVYDLPKFNLTHADLYRINEPEEIDELGFEEAREAGVVLVEWPEKAQGELGKADFAIFLEHQGNGRKITIEAEGRAADRLKRSLEIREFLKSNNRGNFKRRYFTGDASARSYEIIYGKDGHEILMNAPAMEMPEQSGQSYGKIAHLATSVSQFVGIDRLILKNGFVAPEILAQDLEKGLLITDDLGRDGVLDEGRKPIENRYIESGKLLSSFHQKEWPKHQKFDDLTLDIPAYDRSVLQAEVSLLLDWYFPYSTGTEISHSLKEEFYRQWEPCF